MPCYSTCLYQLAKRRMMSANVSATNFAYLLKIMRTDSFIQKDLCIVDECQAIESVLRDEFVVQMTESTLQVINDLKENMRKEVKSDILSICMQSLKKFKYNFKKIDITKIDYNNINEVNEFVEKVAEDIDQEQQAERAAKEQEQQEIENDIRMQAAEDGNIYPVTLDGDTEYEYRIASGNFEIDENGKYRGVGGNASGIILWSETGNTAKWDNEVVWTRYPV